MTKDEQIGHLFDALETIAYGHVHSCGEDAEDMRNEAKEAIAIWRNASQPTIEADAQKRCAPGRHALYPDCNYCPICGEKLRTA